MTDHLLGHVLSHPGVLRVAGRLMCAAAAALALLGLRLDRLVLHFIAATPNLDTLLPSWLAWAVPETFLGWLAVAMLFAIGFCIAQGARAIERLTRSVEPFGRQASLGAHSVPPFLASEPGAEPAEGTMPSDSEVTSTPEFDSRSTRTRAEVQGELEQARSEGHAPGAGEVTPTPDIDTAKSTTTREEVRKELGEHIRSGQRDRDRGETQIGG